MKISEESVTGLYCSVFIDAYCVETTLSGNDAIGGLLYQRLQLWVCTLLNILLTIRLGFLVKLDFGSTSVVVLCPPQLARTWTHFCFGTNSTLITERFLLYSILHDPQKPLICLKIWSCFYVKMLGKNLWT